LQSLHGVFFPQGKQHIYSVFLSFLCLFLCPKQETGPLKPNFYIFLRWAPFESISVERWHRGPCGSRDLSDVNRDVNCDVNRCLDIALCHRATSPRPTSTFHNTATGPWVPHRDKNLGALQSLCRVQHGAAPCVQCHRL